MSKKNLPNIPLYIGDWEKDCNVLTLETEAAWLRIVFKMFTNGKQSTYKIPANGLQNLWKCSAEKVRDILLELEDYNICGISIDGRFVEFTCRRFEKENYISQIRSDAAKSTQNEYKIHTKQKQKTSKTPIKKEQNTDIDNENESDIENTGKEGSGEKPKRTVQPKPEAILPFDTELFKSQWQLWKVFKAKEHKFHYKTDISEQAALQELNNLASGDEKTAIAIIHQSMAKGWKGFFELKNTSNGQQQSNSGSTRQQYSDEFQRKIAEGLQS